METQPLDGNEDKSSNEVPGDVAVLYSWANLSGARYRDFTTNRREYRAQLRQRAAEHLRAAEPLITAAPEAAIPARTSVAASSDSAAAKLSSGRGIHAVMTAVVPKDLDETQQAEYARKAALREAAQQARKDSAERLLAARRAEAAALADSIARREEREIAEAQAAALRQAAQYAEAEFRSKQARAAVSPKSVDAAEAVVVSELSSSTLSPPASAFPAATAAAAPSDSGQRSGRVNPSAAYEEFRRGSGSRAARRPVEIINRIPEERAGESVSSSEPRTGRESLPEADFVPELSRLPTPPLLSATPLRETKPEISVSSDALTNWPVTQEPVSQPAAQRSTQDSKEASGPAWLYPRERYLTSDVERERPQTSAPRVQEPLAPRGESSSVSGDVPVAAESASSSQDSLSTGSRWFALRGALARKDRDDASDGPERQRRTPILAVFAHAGGVGKSSLVAALGRTLSSLGERVLLTDTTSHGLLPFYFGSNRVYPGVLRTFLPPGKSTASPIHLINYKLDTGKLESRGKADAQAALVEDLLLNSQRADRVLIDLNEGSEWVVERLAQCNPTVLVPLVADMNSVLSLQTIEKNFSAYLDEDGQPLLPIYLLNHFDVSLPLHVDIREMFKEQLGDRFLPIVVRRAPGVSEALAEGMTIVDYDAESPVAWDYLEVAKWIRDRSAPPTLDRSIRWSER